MSSPYDPSVCPTDADQVMPVIRKLLPEGPAWDASLTPGTIMYQWWHAIATVVAWIYSEFCAYIPEFFCSTASVTYDQWLDEYGILDSSECEIWGQNLCLKATNLGGQSCEYFTDLAASAGWVITCNDRLTRPAQAGCFSTGCTPLGLTPTPIYQGTNLSVGALSACDYGPAVDHPYPQYWNAKGRGASAPCPVPGSSLGQANPGGCCFTVGYFTPPPAVDPSTIPESVCSAGTSSVFYFPVPDLSSSFDPFVRLPTDTTGKFEVDPSLFSWQVTVDLAASVSAQKLLSKWKQNPWSMPNGFQVGCTQLNGLSFNGLLCFLDEVMPAHTQLFYKVK